MREVAEIVARLAELERRVFGMMRHGTVAQVDAGKGLVRIKAGEGPDGDFLGPWVPYAQTAGGLKVHTPPTVGQQMTMMAPGGDWRQGVAIPFTWSDNEAAPSGAADENVLTYGDATIRLKGGSLEVVFGSVTFKVSNGGVDITGGHVRHNGKSIGAGHVHGQVMPGGGLSGPPAN